MKTEKKKFSVVLALTIAHNYLFWQEYIGINLPLFSSILILCMVLLNPQKTKTTNFWLVLTGALLTSFLVIINNTYLCIIIHMISIIVLIGFIHFPLIKNLVYAFGSSFEGLNTFCKSIKSLFEKFKSNSNWVCRFKRAFKLIIIPALVLLLFYWIYSLANPKFNEISTLVWSKIIRNIALALDSISFEWICMVLITFILTGGAIYKSQNHFFYKKDQSGSDIKIRFKMRKEFNTRFSNTLSLKTEYKIAVLMVLMVNCLLLLVNIIDIQWIWFGFNPSSIKNLSQFVHEGTYLLIVSILISIGIILFFFRSNLNFYTKNRLLKSFCYLWIAQNVVLCVSVALRNYHYINAYGLAHKRIGVIIFLIITIIGLGTLFIKIIRTYSGFYLWRVNSWSVYWVLIVCSFINWDVVIAQYNLEVHKKNVDFAYLLSLSDKTTPLLYKNIKLIESQKNNPVNSDYKDNIITCIERLDYKRQRLNSKVDKSSWKSWNYADYSAYIEMKNINN